MVKYHFENLGYFASLKKIEMTPMKKNILYNTLCIIKHNDEVSPV